MWDLMRSIRATVFWYASFATSARTFGVDMGAFTQETVAHDIRVTKAGRVVSSAGILVFLVRSSCELIY